MDEAGTEAAQGNARDPAERLHGGVTLLLQIVMGAELAAAVAGGLWLTALVVVAVMALTSAPFLFRDRLPVRVPYVFQMAVVLFVFASLFLGEIRDFYERIWWWDMALHFASGLLLAVFGFMLLYILNADARVNLTMLPGFMALFVFCFALSLGALWEIFEFAVDRMLGTRMQKPMLGDPSGLTDTMWDLILDAAGALLVAAYGWYWMRRGQPSFLQRAIERVARENPGLFIPRPRHRRAVATGPPGHEPSARAASSKTMAWRPARARGSES